jgi:hypothetical protein
MWGVSCPLQEEIGGKKTNKKRGKNKTKKQTIENQKRKTGIPVGKANAD